VTPLDGDRRPDGASAAVRSSNAVPVVFIGATPRPLAAADIARDGRGYVLTGDD